MTIAVPIARESGTSRLGFLTSPAVNVMLFHASAEKSDPTCETPNAKRLTRNAGPRPVRRGPFLKIITMELELIRTYYPAGTNGKIQYQNRLMMYSIELPWKDNQTGVSCIPEGRYELVKRWSLKFGRHLND